MSNHEDWHEKKFSKCWDDDAEDAPISPPPPRSPSVSSAFAAPAQSSNIKSVMCNCLGR